MTTVRFFWAASLLLASVALLPACPNGDLPDTPAECDESGAGCLSDEVCVAGRCQPQPSCEVDDDCQSAAYECVLPAQVCRLRAGFGEECSALAPCGPDAFCALGLCVAVEGAIACAARTDCPAGMGCSRLSNLCIQEAPCRLAEAFPELACDANEVCDALTGLCRRDCSDTCTSDDECPGQRCGACGCVQCLTNDDCGAGLVCNQRAGRCQSEDLCFSDADCDTPLECNAATLLCQVPPPSCVSDFDCAINEVCNVETSRCVSPQGPCDDDRFEEADTPATARALDLLSGSEMVLEALTLCTDDDDVYAIGLSAGDTLVVTAADTNANALATVWLLDALGETSVAFAYAPPQGNGTFSYAAEIDEIVYLRVNAAQSDSPYTLHLSRTSGTPCVADFFEGETDNNVPTRAASPELVPVGADLNAAICAGDIDYYAVDVAAGESIGATLLQAESDTDLDVAIVDDGDVVLAESAGRGTREEVARRFYSTRRVFVRVRGFGNAKGAYTLRVTRSAPFVCVADAFEADNAPAFAQSLTLGEEVTAHARTLCALDEDWLRMPLEDFERAVIRLAYSDADVEARVDVLDETATTVLATSPPGRGGAALSFALPTDVVGTATVLVRIAGVGGAQGPYALSIAKENRLDCVADLSEPNDTVDAAQPLVLDAVQDLTLCEPDQDFFVVAGHTGKVLGVEAAFRHAEADIDIEVRSADGTLLLASGNGSSDGERVDVTLPVDGDYIVRVYAARSGANARYQLFAEERSP